MPGNFSEYYVQANQSKQNTRCSISVDHVKHALQIQSSHESYGIGPGLGFLHGSLGKGEGVSYQSPFLKAQDLIFPCTHEALFEQGPPILNPKPEPKGLNHAVPL